MIQIISSHEALQETFNQMFKDALKSLPNREPEKETILLTGEELCKKLGVTIQTLIRWRHKGKIPFMRIGSSIRYDFIKVLEAIEVGKKKGAIKI
jgi:excisionase family DNA binding protein